MHNLTKRIRVSFLSTLIYASIVYHRERKNGRGGAYQPQPYEVAQSDMHAAESGLHQYRSGTAYDPHPEAMNRDNKPANFPTRPSSFNAFVTTASRSPSPQPPTLPRQAAGGRSSPVPTATHPAFREPLAEHYAPDGSYEMTSTSAHPLNPDMYRLPPPHSSYTATSNGRYHE
jgi:hypothetical protein